MNITLPYKYFNNIYNWNLSLISNNSFEYFKLNYSDTFCTLENVYIKLPYDTKERDEFVKMFTYFKNTMHNRCSLALNKCLGHYTFISKDIAQLLAEIDAEKEKNNNTQNKFIRINNIRINNDNNSLILNIDCI